MSDHIKLHHWWNKSDMSSLNIGIRVSNPMKANIIKAHFEIRGVSSYYLSESVIVQTNEPSPFTLAIHKYTNYSEYSLQQFTIVLVGSDGKDIASLRPSIRIANLLSSLYQGSLNLNIYLIGPPGAGKSSYINSIFTMLSSGETVLGNIAVSGGTGGHCTEVLQRYRLMNLDTEQASSVRIFDTWGCNETTYSHNRFSLICRGGLAVGSNIGDLPNLTSPSTLDGSIVPHCIVFFVPASDLVGGTRYLEMIADRVKEAIYAQLGVVICISRIDEQNTYRSYLTREGVESDDCEPLVSEAKKAFGIARNKIVPLMTYQDQTVKSLTMDMWSYRALSTAICEAKATHLAKQRNNKLFS